MAASWFSSLLLVGTVLSYYGGLDPRFTSLAVPVAASFRSTRFSSHEIESILRLFLAAVLQLAFAFVLFAVLAVDAKQVFGFPSVALLLLGALIGLGELALGSFLAHVLVRVLQLTSPRSGPKDMRHWLTMSRAGWMQTYLKTISVAPKPVSLGATALYVAVEEIVFRGLLITYLLPLGSSWAIALSTLMFGGVQAFQMPGWRNAIFPVVGALVMGIVHGMLFVVVPDVTPLIVAHLMFFLIAAR